MELRPTMPGSCKRENTGLNTEYKETVLRPTLMMQANQSTHICENKNEKSSTKKQSPKVNTP